MVSIGHFPRCSFIALLGAALIGCQSTSQGRPSVPRYLVTDSPIDVGDGIRLCLAVDTSEQDGVWWWEAGGSGLGCASRSTGPGVFHAEEAKVSQTTPTSPTALGFRLATHSASRPFIDVRLVLEGGRMRAMESGARVPVQRRKDLDVPEVPMRGQRQTG